MAQKKLEKKANPFPKVPKARLPKSLGLCVDAYHDVRQQRLEAERYAKQWKEEEQRIFDHILNNIPKGDEGAVGKKFKAIRTETDVYNIADDAEFYGFIKKTGAFDLLNRAINQRAVRERLDDEKFNKKYPKGVPGTSKFTRIGLSVTKK